ncbi:MAG: hypothetical protein C4527_25180 [Candidatus Omnitrophota bacterium]|jgi:hypothetical protein|nr:MAG: hypothetical protein C4527_25180 [Candidatus Omnitrophota bacterium]
MNSTNILEPIWESYMTTIDCLKVASRCIENKVHHLMKKTKFVTSSIDEAKEMISYSREKADDFVIVSLWAIFERELLGYVQKEGGKLLQKIPTSFNTNVHRKVKNEMEYWKSDDVLDLFKTVVNSDLIGNAKQVKKYRDWIAHKNPKKGPPSNVPPHTAYRILSDIISIVEQNLEDKQSVITA